MVVELRPSEPVPDRQTFVRRGGVADPVDADVLVGRPGDQERVRKTVRQPGGRPFGTPEKSVHARMRPCGTAQPGAMPHNRAQAALRETDVRIGQNVGKGLFARVTDRQGEKRSGRSLEQRRVFAKLTGEGAAFAIVFRVVGGNPDAAHDDGDGLHGRGHDVKRDRSARRFLGDA